LAFAPKFLHVKNLLISASLVAVGVWYFHQVIDNRAHAPQPQEQRSGDIVVAKAPNGWLNERWTSPTPAATIPR
jgi:hypothetical protein